MSALSEPGTDRASADWRSIALPVEHGGWGFTLEPIVLGSLLAPSAAAGELAVATLAAFFARRPLKLVTTDLVRERWLPRSTVAATVAAVYIAVALASVVAAALTAQAAFWPPYLLAAPLAAYAMYEDAHTRGRTLGAELAGAIAMGSTASAIALADGWDLGPALGLWLVLAARSVASIVLVRGQIRRVHGRPARERAVYGVQVAAGVAVAAAAVFGIVPWLAVVAIAAIGVVAYVSLARPPVAAKVVGWTQMAVGLGVVLLTALGFWLAI